MKSQKARTVMRLLMICLLVSTSTALMTGSQISQRCHCDITSSFCDFGCCCDTECGSSSYYCPKTDFFKSVKSGSATINGAMCYYYNASITTVNEQALTNTQRARLVSENTQSAPLASTVYAGYKGYKMGSVLTIGGKSAFSFIDSTGSCINSTTSSTQNYNLRFGMNAKISCTCTNCGTPLLFSDIIGKSIPQYLDLTGNDIQIPSFTYTLVSTIRVNFIIGKYGSQNINYIDRVTYTYETGTISGTKTLYLNFINSDNIKEMEDYASFFPQIPSDIFYPIHLMS